MGTFTLPKLLALLLFEHKRRRNKLKGATYSRCKEKSGRIFTQYT